MDKIRSDVLDEGLDDWFQLVTVAWLVSQELPDAPRDEKIEAGATVIRSLLEDGMIRVGDVFDGQGFVAWEMSIDDIVKHIEAKWRSLPKEPSIGDVCWIENTDLGDKYAQLSLEHNKTKGVQ
jgi:hypothetical protein